MHDLIQPFITGLVSGEIEVYNEFSLQHELGVFLRSALSPFKVQFERNIAYYGFNRQSFIKKEIDISVSATDINELPYAIELKYPRNGQHPEQMFSFCKDIVFIEQLKSAGFDQAYLMILADDKLFYTGANAGIYSYFRAGKPLHGRITKPTGKRDGEVNITGRYIIEWYPVVGDMKYALIEAQ